MTRQIGIEVASTAVRVACVEHHRARTQLVGWGEAPLPGGAVVDGGVAELEVVTQALLKAARAAKLRRHPLGSPLRARLAVAGLRAITRQVVMPPMSDAEAEAAARFQALEVVPFPPERTLLEVRRLAHQTSEAGVVMLLEAAHRDLVEPTVAAATGAGFVVDSVELSSSALVRSLARGPEGGAEAIVSVGAELTTLVVHEAGEIRFVRTIASGGATVTRALASTLDIPFEDAEAMKIRLGHVGGAGGVPAEAAAAARDASALLLSEIRSSISYYTSMAGSAEVTGVVLAGGGAVLAGMAERLQFQMAAPMVKRSCLEAVTRLRVDSEPSLLAERGAVAIGLALAPPARGRPGGLLPPEQADRRRSRNAGRAVLAGVGILLVGAAATGALRYEQVQRAERDVKSLTGSIDLLERALPAYDKVQALDATALTDEALARPLVSSEVDWPSVLAILARSTPSQVTTVGLTGSASTTATPTSAAATSATPTSATPTSATPTSATPTSAAATSASGSPVIGTLQLSLSSATYPGFQSWFDAIERSHYFQVVQYSGLTSSSAAVAFTAQVDLSDLAHASPLPELKGLTP